MRIEIEPIFSGNAVPIVFSSNQAFVPVLATMIQSILEHTSKEKNYDIIVLTQDIDNTNKKRLCAMSESWPNIQIRVVDVGDYFKEYTLYIENREDITVETYFRLVIPQIMQAYDKVIYLDGDMIANTDIAELFEMEIEDYLIIASADCDSIGRYHHGDAELKEYREKVLKLECPDQYFCAGVLVMNLKRFREMFAPGQLLQIAASYNWRQHDQDVLNMICNKNARLISTAWDLLRDAGNNQYMPEELYRDFLEAEREPKIIHYGGRRKPWIYFDVERGEYFWRYAGKTPFYREILSMVNAANLERYICTNKGTDVIDEWRIKEVALEQFAQGKIGFRYIWRYFKAWLGFKLRRKA